MCVFLTSCTKYIVPEKFDVDHSMIKSFAGRQSIQVVVPKNAETKYLIEYSGTSLNLYVDLNTLYINAKELIEDVLVKHNVPLSNNSKQYIKFTISKIQCEVFGMGWGGMGASLEFDIETADGYHKHFTVQDRSFVESRAVGGTITRAVEKIFQDENIISYIEADLSLPKWRNESHDI